MQDASYIVGIFFLLLPRLGLGEVLVAETGQVHQFGLCLAETVPLHAVANALRELPDLLQHLFLQVGHGSHLGNHAAVIFVRQRHRAVDKVAEDGEQLVVVLGLEVAPCEVSVLGLRRNGGEHIAQRILLTRELAEVLVQPDGPVA